MAKETKLVWHGDIKKEDMQQAMNKGLIRGTNLVRTTAILKAPVDEGTLRASIVTMVDALELIGIVSTNLEYAPYIEFGTGIKAEGGDGRKTPWVYFHPKYGFIKTVGYKPQPFMRPALSENKAKIRKIFIDEGKKAVA